MNAERLNALARTLKKEIAATNYPALIAQLADQLSAVAREPMQPAHQQNANGLREQLETALRESPTNSYSPAWRQTLSELGVANLVGNGLLAQVNAVYARSAVTPATAAEAMAPLAELVRRLDVAVDGLIGGFDFFEIGAEELDPGEFEIGFLIPRVEVDDDLEGLGREFQALWRILAPFVEITTGSRPDMKVRSISSSEFQVFLHALPETAALVAVTVERLIAAWSNIMSIRVAYAQLEQANVSEERLKQIAEEADERMGAEIDVIVGDVLKRVKATDGRVNELRTEMTRSLSELADRIDRGYNVQVEVGELPEAQEDDSKETTAELAKLRKWRDAVLAAQPQLAFMNETGKPILHLAQHAEAAPSSDDGKPDTDAARPTPRRRTRKPAATEAAEEGKEGS